MAEPLASSAAGRIRSCRRDLVLQLATRRGPFWVAVAGLRARWQLDPPIQLPSPLEPRRFRLGEADCYIPQPWPASLDRAGNHRRGTPVGSGPSFEDVMPRPEWADAATGRHPLELDRWADLGALHDAVVPPACTRRGRKAVPKAAPLLSACVLFDPPRDARRDFADPTTWYDLPPWQDPVDCRRGFPGQGRGREGPPERDEALRRRDCSHRARFGARLGFA